MNFAVIFMTVVSVQAADGPVAGPDAARCERGGAPAVLVRVTGLENRRGTIRVRLFGGLPDSYFVRERALVRTQIPTPARDPVDICIPVPQPGVYAIDVRHDVNGDDKTDMSDGGGISGNPRPSLWSVITRRKPPPAAVQFTVERAVKTVPVTMLYLRGGRLRSGSGTD